MKSKKIYAMFQKKDVLKLWNKLYDDNGETKIAMQYLSDGTAVYPLENLPLFDTLTIKGLLELDPDDKLNCFLDAAPEWFETVLADYDDSDVPLAETADMFGHSVLETFHNKNENGDYPELCFFVDPKYLAPLSDEKYDLFSRTVKITETAARVIVAKAGLILKAVIIPHTFNAFDCNKNFATVEKAYCILRDLRDTYKSRESEDEIKL